jgi:hypothetical protein
MLQQYAHVLPQQQAVPWSRYRIDSSERGTGPVSSRRPLQRLRPLVVVVEPTLTTSWATCCEG